MWRRWRLRQEHAKPPAPQVRADSLSPTTPRPRPEYGAPGERADAGVDELGEFRAGQGLQVLGADDRPAGVLRLGLHPGRDLGKQARAWCCGGADDRGHREQPPPKAHLRRAPKVEASGWHPCYRLPLPESPLGLGGAGALEGAQLGVAVGTPRATWRYPAAQSPSCISGPGSRSVPISVVPRVS